MTTHERELTHGPVDLCRSDGTLAPEAVGWSRRPVHRANLRGWGRTKRWEYWCVTTPTHLVALTVSDLDFLRLDAVYVLELGAGGREIERTALRPGGPGTPLPEGVAGAPGPFGGHDLTVGPTRPVRDQVRIGIRREGPGTRLTARCLAPGTGEQVEVDVYAGLPEGHETLSVVVPWGPDRFQYTSKQTALPAHGHVRIGRRELPFAPGDSWAVLDHGRGRWPRVAHWNWGAGSGRTGGRTVGLQFGGRWTEGTGATENALCVDGKLSKLGEELTWSYDLAEPLAPWRVRTPAPTRSTSPSPRSTTGSPGPTRGRCRTTPTSASATGTAPSARTRAKKSPSTRCWDGRRTSGCAGDRAGRVVLNTPFNICR